MHLRFSHVLSWLDSSYFFFFFYHWVIPSPVFLTGESHGQRSLVCFSPWHHKELDTAEHAHTILLCLEVPRFINSFTYWRTGFPHSSVGKESVCNAGDLGLIAQLRRSPGEGNGNPLQYSCLKNPTDGGAWQTIVHGVARAGHSN